MTLKQFGEMVAQIDPTARRYYTAERGDFTTWAEYERIPAFASGRNQGGWKVQLERYTTQEDDEIAQRLEEMLEACDEIAFEYIVDSQRENEAVTIRHLFDCEVW